MRPPGQTVPRRGWIVFAAAVAALVVFLAVYFQRGFIPGDATVYLAAGQRLNTGHHLYSLSPGDSPVGLKPPYWTVPLLSPPLIGVIFRPLAALPGSSGAYVWWALTISAMASSLLLLARQRPGLTGLALLLLVIPVTYEIGVGNVNALLLLGALGTWWLATRGREQAAGAVVAAMVAVKLTPGVFVLWLLVQRRWRALAACVVAGLVLLGVGIAGAGLQAHLDFLGIARQTNVNGTSDLSLAGMARFVGVPGSIADLLPWAALGAGLLAMLALRNRPGPSFAAAVVTWVFASPVVNINTFALLLAALAPTAWPEPAAERPPLAEPAPGRKSPATVQAGEGSSAIDSTRTW